MRRIPLIVAAAALGALLPALLAMPSGAMAAPAAVSTGSRIVDLGTLGGPQDASTANAVNNRGEVVGWSSVNDPFVVHAFLWRHGRMTDLAPLGQANDINDLGVVVGNGASANGEGHGFRWAHGELTDLGTLGGDWSEARAINNHGQIVGLSRTADGMPHGFVWANGKMTNLAPMVNADDINDRGQVVGDYPTPSGSHAAIYDLHTHKLTDLGALPSWFSEATAVNQRGQVAGYIGDAGPGHPVNSAFFWSKGQMDAPMAVKRWWLVGGH
jgi:probable HAF family extracellular repeat protein